MKTLQALYDEHRSIAAVLTAFRHLLRELERGRRVDARVFRQILYYLDVFPERHHHPKEDQVLFAAVRARSAEAGAVIERLEAQHAQGAQAIRRLEQLLLRWEAGGAVEQAAFIEAAMAFTEGYFEHMRIEEDQLMPLAEQALGADDWAAIAAAFAAHRDPLAGVAGVAGAADPQELFRRILHLAPAPIGLGDPLT